MNLKTGLVNGIVNKRMDQKRYTIRSEYINRWNRFNWGCKSGSGKVKGVVRQ